MTLSAAEWILDILAWNTSLDSLGPDAKTFAASLKRMRAAVAMLQRVGAATSGKPFLLGGLGQKALRIRYDDDNDDDNYNDDNDDLR